MVGGRESVKKGERGMIALPLPTEFRREYSYGKGRRGINPTLSRPYYIPPHGTLLLFLTKLVGYFTLTLSTRDWRVCQANTLPLIKETAMRLTTKGRFAVTAMLDLAMRDADGPVTLAGISERQGISLSYLEQLFGKLRRAALVESVRGPGGGYCLAKSPDALWVADIILGVDEPLDAGRGLRLVTAVFARVAGGELHVVRAAGVHAETGEANHRMFGVFEGADGFRIVEEAGFVEADGRAGAVAGGGHMPACGHELGPGFCQVSGSLRRITACLGSMEPTGPRWSTSAGIRDSMPSTGMALAMDSSMSSALGIEPTKALARVRTASVSCSSRHAVAQMVLGPSP